MKIPKNWRLLKENETIKTGDKCLVQKSELGLIGMLDIGGQVQQDEIVIRRKKNKKN